ncbi:acyl-CoA dehydrogenase family protein [filamentous cyanobacterium LEGE 11480]|uniref:Acyl-CoA dehydrogenase family protein n=1 Tax=Romeriopsis navalis LEGE 11480 TaxID=2777977 RepID=A0A928Z116_9CYAN|nr:acyl-CoA dehydrogenase family protein [Romeriopsis navalis]MBE9028846.1 acyl-CoA dehydrogenase family protein [Romeriopsis navalis LEGE 11480]
MDFSWSDEQLAFKQKVVQFAQDHLNDNIVERDHHGQFSWENWKQCAAFGIQGMCMPEAYSASPALDIMTAVLAMEALGYGCHDNGLTLALNAQMWTVQILLLKFGTDDQKQRYLPRLCNGEWIGVHALSEPNSGSDVYSLTTRAEKCEGGYKLNGHKKFVTCAPICNLALVFATLDPSLGKWGVTAFLVERESTGFATGPVKEKMGLRTAPFGEIYFEDCFVPEANRLGPEGAGFSFSHSSLEYDRCFNLASELGTMERQLEQTVEYAKSREQYGQPIGKFQSVSNRVADMKLRLETARLLLYKVAWLKERDQPAMLEAALLKLYLSECFVASGLDAVRIHGGNGYLSEHGVERDLRDAIGGVIYAGTSDIQRNIIARSLGL